MPLKGPIMSAYHVAHACSLVFLNAKDCGPTDVRNSGRPESFQMIVLPLYCIFNPLFVLNRQPLTEVKCLTYHVCFCGGILCIF